MTILSPAEWNEYLSNCPDAHLLQTAQWGELKSNFGWEPVHLVSEEGGVSWGLQLLFRWLPFGISFAYLPKGPLRMGASGQNGQAFPGESFWSEVDHLCRKRRSIFLKLEPDHWASAAGWPDGEIPQGFIQSPQSIQPPRTIVIDLNGSEDQILARMKQKTRYNIRLASKKGVEVQASEDVAAFYQLMQATGERDQFGIHSAAYYQTAFDLFSPSGKCILLMAEFAGEQIAGLMAFVSGRRAWYLYGASGSTHRERMPTYLLQWEAIKWARSQGCEQYDLYGVPDYDPEYLEEHFNQLSDGLWGIYRFKRGFGGEVSRSTGPWDRVYNSFLYQIYLRWTARTVSED
jgi:peptidoglycan pentaglycine glycine transferase (the first glycine)